MSDAPAKPIKCIECLRPYKLLGIDRRCMNRAPCKQAARAMEQVRARGEMIDYLHDEMHFSYAMIGNAMGISRTRVHQLHMRYKERWG